MGLFSQARLVRISSCPHPPKGFKILLVKILLECRMYRRGNRIYSQNGVFLRFLFASAVVTWENRSSALR